MAIVRAPVVVILAAGQGTRMRSATPKLLHPLCGRPIIEWLVASARAASAARVVVVDSPARRLEAALGDGVELAIQERPLGTADAVGAALGHVGPEDTVVVLNGDAPLVSCETLARLVEEHERAGSAATIVTVTLEDPAGYGRVVRGADGGVERVVETKAPGDASAQELRIREVNTGMFAFHCGALASALGEVRADNAQGERYLPDVLPVLRGQGRAVAAHELTDREELLQINDRGQLAEVTAVAQRRIHEAHMLSGVTIVSPAATVIDAAVEIAPDTVIAPFTSLLGGTRVAAECVIGPHSTLIDAEVGAGARVVHSYISGAVVGERVSVGPFAYLRPGTVLEAGSKAGTFVEIKNSRIGPRSKVPHLSYIGDTEVGEDTNLGASTITANYDGYVKNRTRIGSRVKTSVDTTLVAPVTIGDDAWTGAGSVISKEVPPGALGIARPRQQNIEGYNERARARHAPAADDQRTGSPAASADQPPAPRGDERHVTPGDPKPRPAGAPQGHENGGAAGAPEPSAAPPQAHEPPPGGRP